MYFSVDQDALNGFFRALSVVSGKHMPRPKLEEAESQEKQLDQLDIIKEVIRPALNVESISYHALSSLICILIMWPTSEKLMLIFMLSLQFFKMGKCCNLIESNLYVELYLQSGGFRLQSIISCYFGRFVGFYSTKWYNQFLWVKFSSMDIVRVVHAHRHSIVLSLTWTVCYKLCCKQLPTVRSQHISEKIVSTKLSVQFTS